MAREPDFNLLTWLFAYIFSVLPAALLGGVSFAHAGELTPVVSAAMSFALGAAIAFFAVAGWRTATRNFGWNRLTTYLLAGVPPGALFALAFAQSTWQGALGCVLGAIQAVIIVWMMRRPDRDPPNPPTSAP